MADRVSLLCYQLVQLKIVYICNSCFFAYKSTDHIYQFYSYVYMTCTYKCIGMLRAFKTGKFKTVHLHNHLLRAHWFKWCYEFYNLITVPFKLSYSKIAILFLVCIIIKPKTVTIMIFNLSAVHIHVKV